MSKTASAMSISNGRGVRSGAPLNAIRVFVEVARTQSFSRAAEIMEMTQSGVSHHISALEKYLGHRLFERSGSVVRLSDVGRQYFDAVREAVASVELSTRQLRNRPLEQRLIVRTSLPTVAMTVLIPALPRFVPQPPVTIDLVTSLTPPGASDVFDVLLTRDLVLPEETHWRLAQEVLVCVAAPVLHARISGQDVVQWPFISTKSRPDVLVEWVNAQGLDASKIRVCASFEHYFLALSAAIGGMGCLVVPKLLVSEPLRQGLLVDLGMLPVNGVSSYTAWVNPRSVRPELARTFCRWLVSVFRAEESSA